MIEGETHYDLLGVRPDATQDKIHRAYTNLLKEAQTIPDSPELRAFMQRAKVAYQVLSRPERRAAYHQQLAMKAPPQRKWEVPGDDRMHPALYMGCFTLIFGIPGLIVSGLFAWLTRKGRAAT
jgi:curved DNA-binding protein CbpA